MYDLSQIKLNYLKDTVLRLTDIPDSEYFGEKYSQYVSNSQLKLINPEEGGSPTKFITGFKEQRRSDALELGTAVHQMILEKDKYYVSDVQKPAGKAGDAIEKYHQLLLDGVEDKLAIQQACIEADYYASNLTDKRIENLLQVGADYLTHLQSSAACESCIVLSTEMKAKLDNCLLSVKANPLIDELIYPKTGQVYNEDVIVMQVEVTAPNPDPTEFEDSVETIWLKVKIDNWSVDVENKVLTLNDLKTTGSSIASFGGTTFTSLSFNSDDTYTKRLDGSFQKFHYYRQMAMYAFLLECYAEKEYGFDDTWTFNINMLVVETNAPHLSHVFSVTEPWLRKGGFEFTQLLKRVGFHKINGFHTFTDVDLSKVTKI